MQAPLPGTACGSRVQRSSSRAAARTAVRLHALAPGVDRTSEGARQAAKLQRTGEEVDALSARLASADRAVGELMQMGAHTTTAPIDPRLAAKLAETDVNGSPLMSLEEVEKAMHKTSQEAATFFKSVSAAGQNLDTLLLSFKLRNLIQASYFHQAGYPEYATALTQGLPHDTLVWLHRQEPGNSSASGRQEHGSYEGQQKRGFASQYIHSWFQPRHPRPKLEYAPPTPVPWRCSVAADLSDYAAAAAAAQQAGAEEQQQLPRWQQPPTAAADPRPRSPSPPGGVVKLSAAAAAAGASGDWKAVSAAIAARSAAQGGATTQARPPHDVILHDPATMAAAAELLEAVAEQEMQLSMEELQAAYVAPEPAAADEPAAAQPAAPLEQAAAAAPVEQAAAVAAAPAPEAVAVAAAPSSATVRLSVAVHCRTCVGQDVVLVGGSASLGSWDATQGLVLTWTDGHVWRGEVEVPAGAAVEFKPVLRQGQQTTWMGGNNLVVAGAAAGSAVTTEVKFRT